ncbi:PadR family transcriptional regulator [Kutzneria albida]|uniref:Transcription regulator PadR N-terminal domain-containing protein n=1 Tax=Kutzneria albida DSM 43870 TaxID=1449976 RepID=W5WIV7_9PSEU|nr:PadR family transcriptional regulator [Kutzneria albida]AHI00651.1 hypothetical protein KALB_7293 [Kutzneria albida DSM 43870]
MRHHTHHRHGHARFDRAGGFEGQFPHHVPQPPEFPRPQMPGMPFAAGGPWPGALGAMAGFGRGMRGGRRGGMRRQRRGNVRAAVLALLAERPMHGYEMIQELAERTGGLWKPSPGSVYPTLQLLADEGLITASEDGGKRLFTLTELGTEEATKQAAAKPWEDMAGEPDQDALQLHSALTQLFMAVDQITQAGTEDQKARAVEAVNEAKRKIYGLLAEDTSDVDDEEE